jgi:plasmid stabilization system protein ParE
MGAKRLEWSGRAANDLANIIRFYAETASPAVAGIARQTILDAARRIASRAVLHRAGKRGTRECVLRKFPYIVIYRATARSVQIVRVLHQAREYFNRR